MNALRLPEALSPTYGTYVGTLNKYIDLRRCRGYSLKTTISAAELADVMVHLSEGLRIVSVLLMRVYARHSKARIQDIFGIER